jgi:hypothetical protein
MSKRTIILTQHQLDEIVGGGGNSPYFDGESVPNNANLISTNGSSDKTNQTTDNFASSLPRGTYNRMGVMSMHEENARLAQKKFGAKDGNPGKSYEATKKTVSRMNQAKKTMQTGATQDIKNQAAKTLQNMQNNNNIDLNTLENQYTISKNIDANDRKKKVQNGERVLKSAPKTGVGTAHTVKTNNNSFITYK